MMSLGTGLASAGASSILLKDLIDPKFVSFLYQEKLRKLQVKKEIETNYLSKNIVIRRVFKRINRLIRVELAAYFRYIPISNTLALVGRTSARGSYSQYNQVCFNRGSMLSEIRRVFGKINGCFFKGIPKSDLLTSVHGCRKGLIDTALNTATSGYLTRKLVEVLQQLFIATHDCGTRDGTTISALSGRLSFIPHGTTYSRTKNLNDSVTHMEKILGRCLSQAVTLDKSGEIWPRNTIITDYHYKKIFQNLSLQKRLLIRNVNTCEDDWGICQKCYELQEFDKSHCVVGIIIGI
jgi:DNA-directed RNA polymerase subunit beta'